VSRIRKAAGFYLANSKSSGLDVRFDVISVIINKSFIKELSGNSSLSVEKLKLNPPGNNSCIKVEHIKNAF